MELNELLSFAIKNDASDIHISAGHVPTLRIHGKIHPLRVGDLSKEEATTLIHAMMSDKQKQQYAENLEIDFALASEQFGRFRANAFTTLTGPAAVLRLIPKKIPPISELKVPSVVRNLTNLTKGLVLITGPTGSGKTTTLASLINLINETKNKHIITIEDPIEYVHTSQKSFINQREIGEHSHSFAKSLKSALRQDPDIILLGEMRDMETISLALTAAETGHLVFGTLHTMSASKAIDRIIDVFPANDKPVIRSMLSGSLEAVVAQTLIPTLNKKGRVAAHEILIANPAVRNLIRGNKIEQIFSIMQVSSKVGMRVMQDAVEDLLDAKLISDEDAKDALNFTGATEEENDDENLDQGANKGNF